jgi:hypothetical protein
MTRLSTTLFACRAPSAPRSPAGSNGMGTDDQQPGTTSARFASPLHFKVDF